MKLIFVGNFYGFFWFRDLDILLVSWRLDVKVICFEKYVEFIVIIE